MLYMNFQPTAPNQWAAISMSTKIADVVLNRNGQCEATLAQGRDFSQDEMDSLSVFMREVEREH